MSAVCLKGKTLKNFKKRINRYDKKQAEQSRKFIAEAEKNVQEIDTKNGRTITSDEIDFDELEKLLES